MNQSKNPECQAGQVDIAVEQCAQPVTLLQVLPPISAGDTSLSFLQNFAKRLQFREKIAQTVRGWMFFGVLIGS